VIDERLRRSAAHVFVESLDAPELQDDDDHHLRRVLRVGAGDEITVSDGGGHWMPARLVAQGVQAAGDVAVVAPSERPLTILSAIPKGDRPEWIVQKLTELGVDTIGFVHCERSVVRWDAQRALRQVQRLRKVAREAAMQSRRVWLPEVLDVAPLTAVDLAGAVLADPSGERQLGNDRRVVIGPEGGFSADELARAGEVVSLGPLVLRVETACLAAAAWAQRHSAL
jgi:16S rRNA (uracil1498-N3)-methyltransferase